MNAVKVKNKVSLLCFLRKHDLKTIRGKLIALYGLNIFDALMTYLLIYTGRLSEVNCSVKGVVFSFVELSLIKILLPAALIAWLYFWISGVTEKQLKLGNVLVNLILFLYTFANILHLVWAATFLAFWV